MRFASIIFTVILGAFFLIMISTSCMKETNATTIVKGASGLDVPIVRLLTIDGCGVFRVVDGTNVSYFSICPQQQVVCPSVCGNTCQPTTTPQKPHRLEEN